MTATIQEIQSDWMTRGDAQEWLRESESTVDDRCIPLEGNPRRVKGKIRTRPMLSPRGRLLPRLMKSDVYAILPPESPRELLEKKGRNFVVVNGGAQ